MTETDLGLSDGRTLHAYDTGADDATAHVSAVADALGIERFAVMGRSGGGPHALACGALLPGRVLGISEGEGPRIRQKVLR